MTPTRKQITSSTDPKFLRYCAAALVLLFAIMTLPGSAGDWDGDGYDDDTGEYLGDSGYLDPWGDADNDGLFNLEELDMGTDPLKQDSDDDGLWDGDEIYGIYTTAETVTEYLGWRFASRWLRGIQLSQSN